MSECILRAKTGQQWYPTIQCDSHCDFYDVVKQPSDSGYHPCIQVFASVSSFADAEYSEVTADILQNIRSNSV